MTKIVAPVGSLEEVSTGVARITIPGSAAPDFGTSADIAPLAYGPAAAAGASGLLADAGHRHLLDPVEREILLAGLAGFGVVSGCEVTAQGTPDMTVAVADGFALLGGPMVYIVTGSNVTIDTADATNPRIDLIAFADPNYAITGTPAANPVMPALMGDPILAAVYVPAGVAAITSDMITDKRVVLPGPVYAVDHGSMGSTETFDYNAGPEHGGAVTAALTLTLTGWPPTGYVGRMVARLTNDGTGGYGVPTLGAEVVNAADWAAVWNDAAGALNEVVFETVDDGTTVYIVNLPAAASGGPLTHDYATVATDEAAPTGAYSDLATAGPAVTVTVNTKAKVTITYDGYDAASGHASGRMGVALSSGNTVAADDTQSLALGAYTDGASTMASRVIYYSGLTPGSTVFTAKYYGSSTNFHFRRREILVECMD